MGVSRAGAGIRVSGEEERGGHGQGAGPAEVADATPQDAAQEHHHQRRRCDSRLTCLMQSPSAFPPLCVRRGATGSTEGSSPLHYGGPGLCARKQNAHAGEETAAAIARGGGRVVRRLKGEEEDGMAVRKGKSSPRQWEAGSDRSLTCGVCELASRTRRFALRCGPGRRRGRSSNVGRWTAALGPRGS